jgi:hypothetical protein
MVARGLLRVCATGSGADCWSAFGSLLDSASSDQLMQGNRMNISRKILTNFNDLKTNMIFGSDAQVGDAGLVG